MPAKQRILLSRYFKMWLSRKWVASFVFSIIPVSIVDAVYTWLNIAEHGLLSELNPIMRWMFQSGLTVFWFLVSVPASFICLALLGSFYVSAADKEKAYIATAFSAILTLRNLAAAYNVTHYYSLLKYPQAILLAAIPSFLLIRYLLLHQDSITWVNFKRSLWALWDNFETALLLLDWGYVGDFFDRVVDWVPQIGMKPVSVSRVRIKRKTRLVALVLLLVLIPFLLFGLLQLMLNFFITQSIPSWYRGLGIVSGVQGVVFLLGFIFIIAALAVILYLIMSIWESVSSP